MSIIFENEIGYYISHKEYIDKLYTNVDGWDYFLNEKLFNIIYPYKRKKATEVKSHDKMNQNIKQNFINFMETLKEKHLIVKFGTEGKNKEALETAEFVFKESSKHLVQNSFGSNIGLAKVHGINKSYYLFPQNCEFYCKDVSDISNSLRLRQFDIIILDPPWWNKYIRRKRKKSIDGYKMMYNNDLKVIPIESLLKENGFVAVWCTNSTQNLEELLNDIFPKWQIHFVAKWYWIKITQSGETICDFSDPPGKQPFEKIIIGAKRFSHLPENGKLVVSIPSAIHSHKPPLIDLLRPYLPDEPLCLEIFARYLLPNFVSYGNEVLRLQHESLFRKHKK